MQNKLGFGGGPTYEISLLIVKPNEYYLIFVLIFDMHVIYFVFVIAH